MAKRYHRITAWLLASKATLSPSIVLLSTVREAYLPAEVKSLQAFDISLPERLPGDDETAHIWVVNGFKRLQVLQDGNRRWGQVTCMKWLNPENNRGETLCFGSGRGLILIYEQHKVSASIIHKSGDQIHALGKLS
jgi:hypothetical protein